MRQSVAKVRLQDFEWVEWDVHALEAGFATSAKQGCRWALPGARVGLVDPFVRGSVALNPRHKPRSVVYPVREATANREAIRVGPQSNVPGESGDAGVRELLEAEGDDGAYFGRAPAIFVREAAADGELLAVGQHAQQRPGAARVLAFAAFVGEHLGLVVVDALHLQQRAGPAVVVHAAGLPQHETLGALLLHFLQFGQQLCLALALTVLDDTYEFEAFPFSKILLKVR
eukprot:CAMPEP_0174283898 /NCGR_PEP_ID=MMETSP0809-20121228/4622_1 /TAXON_ID=73025 ORGANISM="Eutreptiella gymnastica-like, Strain CCMP1594" /NCGR_SAMPLE_ID=MMETSP0809 /ASSEMBLY_ACC=CAM_ASM_000658 /LENGTH=228 /DNA_ID=CAMNT_0015379099 /DNA_START=210 /DNA_END=898 /DNA_ORIENTATION=-